MTIPDIVAMIRARADEHRAEAAKCTGLGRIMRFNELSALAGEADAIADLVSELDAAAGRNDAL